MYRKTLICAIITLFIGASSVPIICGNIEQSSYNPISLSLNDGLVGFWIFDEGDGSIAYDYSGNGNDGTLYGAMWVDGISGKALGFGGINDYVDLGYNTFNSLTSGTVSTWIKLNVLSSASTAQPIFAGSKTDVNDDYFTLQETDNGKLVGFVKSGDIVRWKLVTDNTVLTTNSWCHIVLVQDGITPKIYVNGDESPASFIDAQDITQWFDDLQGTILWWIGYRHTAVHHYCLNGIIDEVRIYDRALNESEIQELYKNPGGVPDKPTITGPRTGKPKQEYDYSFSSLDPDDDTIYYYIDWGDDQVDEWIGPFPSGFEVKIGHTWEEKGTYIISAKSKDNAGKESDWTTFAISMPKNKIINPFERFLDNHPHMFPLLRYLIGIGIME